MAGGECNCGAVAFEIDGEPTDVFICHCSVCRRFTGGNGIAVVLTENTAFRWLRGEDQIRSWKKPGADWEARFCRICGSPVPGANDDTRTYIPAGTLVYGAANLKVAHHIWVGSRAGWDEIGDDGKQHPEAFEG